MRSLASIVIIILISITTSSFNGGNKGKLTADEKQLMTTAKVMMVYYEAPPLNFMTPKDAVGEGLVSKITQSEQADSHERHRFYPSKMVHKRLDSLFRAKNLFTNSMMIEEGSEFEMPAELKDLSKYADADADYIVEVIVPLMGWQASYSPTKWRTYSLNLGVEVRIIRKGDLTRIWKTNVGHGGLNDKRLKFHISELEENGHEKIEKMLEIAVEECSNKVIENYLKAKK